ncbi:MAG TPA: hypothetical protein V6C89_10290 [Drouetiella sp.]|jgi:hypothetical protein
MAGCFDAFASPVLPGSGRAKKGATKMDGSKICQISTGQEDDWTKLYETAFPADERSPVDELRKLIAGGSMLLHKTVNKNDELLCFSLVNVMSNFALLAYIATDTTKRSGGFGSKHMKQLIQTLRAQYPSFTALFLEIESTKEAGLDAATHKLRTRRLGFYQRLGAKRLKQKYGMPSYAKKGSKAAGELLWIELANGCVFEADLPNVITEIFQKGYGLPTNDPNVVAIISQWAASLPATPAVCAIPEDPIVIASSTPATPATTSGTPVDPAASSTDDGSATKNGSTPVTPQPGTKDSSTPATPAVDTKNSDSSPAAPVPHGEGASTNKP